MTVSQSAPSIGTHDVQALAARQLDEAFELDAGEPFAHVARGRDDVRPADALARIEIEHDAVADLEAVDHRAAHVHFEHARLHQREQTVEVLDRDDLPALAVDHGAQVRLVSPAEACFWKKHSPAVPSGQRSRLSGRLTTCGAIQSQAAR